MARDFLLLGSLEFAAGGVAFYNYDVITSQLNCETDFVARTEKFQSLLGTAIRAILHQKSPPILDTTNFPSVDFLTQDVMKTVETERKSTVADLIAEAVGQLSENIVLTRGCTMSVSEGLICPYVYNSVPLHPGGMGTYAALVHLLPTEHRDLFEHNLEARFELGCQLGQHIVGMNPTSVHPQEGREESEALLGQNFVLDSSIRVADMLSRDYVQVTKFVRYALGEANATDS